jgi:hypothetical protein
MSATDLDSLEYAAEFERQQFTLYDARRLAAETHANAVIAVAITVAALVLNDFANKGHPRTCWLVIAMAGLSAALGLANIARFVSFKTPPARGGKKWPEPVPADAVKRSLEAVRKADLGDAEQLRRLTLEHWRDRAKSAHKLGALKDRRLRQALIGFLGPLIYFGVAIAS